MKFLILPFYKAFGASITLFFLSISVSFGQQTMRGNLYVLDNNNVPTLIDGNLTMYNSQFSNAVDWNDAYKLSNFGENFGIIRDNITLVIERRNVICVTDTTTFRMWNMQQRNYQLQLVLQNMNIPGIVAVLKDHYLQTSTPVNLNGTTYYNFSVNANAGSASQQRFQLVYFTPTTSTIPVTLTGITATRNGTTAYIHWSVENEIAMEQYEVEHSSNGIVFSRLSEVNPVNDGNNKTYEAKDENLGAGSHFYRIRAISRSGQVQYSNVAKIDGSFEVESINVYPNPVVGHQLRVRFTGIPTGKYNASIINSAGVRHALSPLNIKPQDSKLIELPSFLSPGVYWFEISQPGFKPYRRSINVL